MVRGREERGREEREGRGREGEGEGEVGLNRECSTMVEARLNLLCDFSSSYPDLLYQTADYEHLLESWGYYCLIMLLAHQNSMNQAHSSRLAQKVGTVVPSSSAMGRGFDSNI